MIATSHTFTVWHPRYDGTPPKYTESEFGFNQPVSRQEARRIIEDIEGYVIQKTPRPRTGPYIYKPRPRKQKIT